MGLSSTAPTSGEIAVAGYSAPRNLRERRLIGHNTNWGRLDSMFPDGTLAVTSADGDIAAVQA
jgi:hypothetical protein